jgi:hypothetical protein
VRPIGARRDCALLSPAFQGRRLFGSVPSDGGSSLHMRRVRVRGALPLVLAPRVALPTMTRFGHHSRRAARWASSGRRSDRTRTHSSCVSRAAALSSASWPCRVQSSRRPDSAPATEGRRSACPMQMPPRAAACRPQKVWPLFLFVDACSLPIVQTNGHSHVIGSSFPQQRESAPRLAAKCCVSMCVCTLLGWSSMKSIKWRPVEPR